MASVDGYKEMWAKRALAALKYERAIERKWCKYCNADLVRELDAYYGDDIRKVGTCRNCQDLLDGRNPSGL